MNLAYLILAALLGQYSHYYVRWKQGRTTSSFKDYMIGEWPGTIQSLSASIIACIGVYIALPEPIETKALLGIIYGAYMSAYTFDSALNRDPGISVPIKKEIENITAPTPGVQRATPPKKSINDILRADRDL